MVQDGTLKPESVLGQFDGPEDRNQICMVVSRTGLTVAARLGEADGTVLARAYDPFAAEPRVEFEDLQRANPKSWKDDFRDRFTAALRQALTGPNSGEVRA